jgi:uncharacterized caspase-like protein
LWNLEALMFFSTGLAKMGRLIRSAALAAIGGIAAMGVATAAVQGEKRVALVIGNGNYQHVGKLPNPLADASAIAVQLRGLGYDVVDGLDLDNDSMWNKINDFRARIDGAKAAVVYYAGHGIAVGGDNYLLPVDIQLKADADEFYIKRKAVSINDLMRGMEGAQRANILILDACRDNPLAKQMRSAVRTRSVPVGHGLSEIKTENGSGMLIAFATAPGQVALDGKPGENSPFTTSLLRRMGEPGVNISTVLDRVRADVYESTERRQTPWTNSALIGEFHLNPRSIAVVPAAPVVAALPAPTGTATDAAPQALPPLPRLNDRVALEQALWQSAEKADTIEDYKAYLAQFPNGVFSQMARGRIARLEQALARPVAPAKAPATVAAPAAPAPVVVAPRQPKSRVAVAPREMAPRSVEPVQPRVVRQPRPRPVVEAAPAPRRQRDDGNAQMRAVIGGMAAGFIMGRIGR